MQGMTYAELKATIENAMNSASVRGGSKTDGVEEILEAVDEFVAAAAGRLVAGQHCPGCDGGAPSIPCPGGPDTD